MTNGETHGTAEAAGPDEATDAPPDGSVRRKRRRLIVLTLLACVVAAEVVSGILMWRVVQVPLLYVDDPHTSFALLPENAEIHRSREYDVTYEVNAQGYRDAPVPVPKPDGARHVVLVGDSFVFGWGVARDETVASQLQALYDGEGAESVRVVNAGFQGNAPDDGYAFLRSPRGRELEPDAVVLFVTVTNDVRDMEGHEWPELDERELPVRVTSESDRANELNGRGPVPYHWKNPILRHSNSVQLVMRAYFAFFQLPERSKRIQREDAARLESGDVYPERMRRVMDGLAAEAAGRGFDLRVAVIPSRPQIYGDPAELADRLTDALTQHLGEARVPHVVLGTDAGFSGDDLFPADGHWNAAGHARAAALVRKLLD